MLLTASPSSSCPPLTKIPPGGVHGRKPRAGARGPRALPEACHRLLLRGPLVHLRRRSLLSINWLRKFLDVFFCCEAEFKGVLLMALNPSQISKPPLDHLFPEFLDNVMKALDVYNPVLHGVESHFLKRHKVENVSHRLPVYFLVLFRALLAATSNFTHQNS
jgi:hypothetical protein